MEEMKNSKKALIVVTFVLYIGHLALNGLAANGGPDNLLFPNSVANVSKAFELEMTPAGPTFAIWGIIFTAQLIWLVYALTTICRSSPSANILSEKVYIAFILNIACLSGWLLAWSRLEGVLSFILTLASQICLNAAIAYTFTDLKSYLDSSEGYKKSSADVWVQRVIVQNALEFYATWTTCATMINFAVVLAYYIGISTRVASIVSLSIIGVLLVLWFIVENSVLLEYTPYTFSVYPVLIIANLGIVYRIYAVDQLVGGLSLALLIASAVGLIVRCTVIIVNQIYKPTRTKTYDTLNES